MDIEGAENKLNQVDSLLTTFTKILKKHWIIITLLLIAGFIYWVVNLPPVEPEVDVVTEEVIPVDSVDNSVEYTDSLSEESE